MRRSEIIMFADGVTVYRERLPEALARAVLELVAERGVRGFSLAEAARRSGVSGSAPYRHYADRDALLAAVATNAYAELGRRLSAAKRLHGSPADQLAAMAGAYVSFAGRHRAKLEVLFNAGLDKSAYPALAAAGDAANAEALFAVLSLCAGDAVRARELAIGLRACAHGSATLLIDGSLALESLSNTEACTQAAATVRTLAVAMCTRAT